MEEDSEDEGDDEVTLKMSITFDQKTLPTIFGKFLFSI